MTRRRGMLRAVLGGMAAIAIALGGATAVVAAEDPAPTGSMSGTVTADVGGAALAGIQVSAQRDGALGRSDAVTDATGGYTLTGLADGTYLVRFSAPDRSFATEYWNNASDSLGAQRVTVTNGSAATGIDAALAPAPSASITGTVTREDDGTPVSGIAVSVTGPGTAWASGFTDASGTYTLNALPAGSYIVRFQPEGTDLKREYWQNAFDYSQATPVVLAEGEAVSGIDASLVAGGAIAGVVTRADDGAPLANVTVNALDANGEIVAFARTNPAGAYVVGGLPAGSYRVQFGAPAPGLVTEYWENAYSFNAAKVVAVGELQTTAGVNAALDSVGYISGSVTKSADGSRALTAITVTDVEDSSHAYFLGVANDGTYQVAVAPGTYRVHFAPYEPGLRAEYWADAYTAGTANPVTVTSGANVVGIDAELDAAALVTGTVSLDSSEGREVIVEAWSGNEIVGTTFADLQTGAYSLALPEGSFILKASANFYNDSTTTAQPQFYDGVATAAQATPVVVTVGAPVSGIDFTLVAVANPEPQPGPALALGAGSIRAGNDITISGTGFTPGATIAFELHSDPIALGTLTADADGALQGTLRIPANVPAGAHTLVALSGTTVISRTALTVTAAAGTGGQAGGAAAAPGAGLATTGLQAPIAIVVIGVVLAMMGGLLVRRRRVES
ncbi:carboxypeptidase regulatory-like domain-containing protein [Microbacterium sp. STF-2]|uniref:MSCRAMM family protein n=1 Tax=Microbacterium sp. STF-2 TaxID=3031132 RepID=UPI002AFEF8D9|nr:carboxypeptidase regulatory-like domain-containing protein [Microbacterium sp. STF-2]MEA1263371.1 carboxypeptidase regulatory-like domain-containing protein [Microbacterium sp. STF-2]